MFKEPDEPSMFDDITILFDSTDNVDKAFRVLDDNLRLCLTCDEVFTRQGAAEHSGAVCRPSDPDTSPRLPKMGLTLEPIPGFMLNAEGEDRAIG